MSEDNLKAIKKEYLDALQQIEKLEHELEELNVILTKSVTRLAIAAKGNESRINKLLDNVKKTVKGTIDKKKLDQLMNQLFDLMNELDDDPEQQTVTKAAFSIEPLQGFIDRIAQLLEQKAPDWQAASIKQELERLYRLLAEKLAHNTQNLPEMLVALLDKLELPDTLAAQKKALIKKLSNGDIPQQDWSILFKEVANLSNQALVKLQKEKRDLQSFIEKITRQLTDIEKFVQQTRSDRKDSANHTDKLHKQVNNSVDHIHREVNQADDLNRLKQNIQSHLENIKENFKHFKRVEQKREKIAEQRNLQIARDLEKSRKETALLKAQLKQSQLQLYKDSLTGVSNRLAYQERVELERSRHLRNKSPLSLAIWDIDYFKRVNDQFGHDAGDRVLRMFAHLISSKLRKTDFFARIGGEEFVLLMPDTDLDGALIICDKLRTMVANSGFNYKGKAFPITASVGIASFRLDGADSADSVFKRADMALYQSKNNGRNRCTASK